MAKSTRPMKMSEVIKVTSEVGCVIKKGSKHLKVTHVKVQRTFTLPTHGSKGRSTLSPGMSSELRKFIQECAA